MPPYQVTPTKIGFHKLFNSQKKKWSQNYLGFMTVVLLGKNHSTMHHFPGLTISSKAPSGNFPVLTGWDWRCAVSRKLTNGLGRLLARWYIISSCHRFQHFHTYPNNQSHGYMIFTHYRFIFQPPYMIKKRLRNSNAIGLCWIAMYWKCFVSRSHEKQNPMALWLPRWKYQP